jgi:hypothetical protein
MVFIGHGPSAGSASLLASFIHRVVWFGLVSGDEAVGLA